MSSAVNILHSRKIQYEKNICSDEHKIIFLMWVGWNDACVWVCECIRAGVWLSLTNHQLGYSLSRLFFFSFIHNQLVLAPGSSERNNKNEIGSPKIIKKQKEKYGELQYQIFALFIDFVRASEKIAWKGQTSSRLIHFHITDGLRLRAKTISRSATTVTQGIRNWKNKRISYSEHTYGMMRFASPSFSPFCIVFYYY